jgi:thiamine-monophosphate kinase
VRIEVRLGEVPLAPGVDALQAATDGDDYELLFTAPAARRDAVERAAGAAGTTVTWLGDVGVGSGLVVRGHDGLPVELSGYEHP